LKKKNEIEMEDIILELVTRHEPIDDKICAAAANWIDILFKYPEYALELNKMIDPKFEYPIPKPHYTFHKKEG